MLHDFSLSLSLSLFLSWALLAFPSRTQRQSFLFFFLLPAHSFLCTFIYYCKSILNLLPSHSVVSFSGAVYTHFCSSACKAAGRGELATTPNSFPFLPASLFSSRSLHTLFIRNALLFLYLCFVNQLPNLPDSSPPPSEMVFSKLNHSHEGTSNQVKFHLVVIGSLVREK